MIPFYEIQPSDLNIINNTREIRFHAHLHKQIEIIYVFKGGQHVNIDGKEYEVHEGEAAVIFPDTVHYYYRSAQRASEEVLLIISPKMLGKLLPDLSSSKAENPVVADVDEVCRAAFESLSESSDSMEKMGHSMVILSRLLPKITIRHDKSAPVEDLTEKMIKYITLNFKQDISLGTLAKEFNVSKYYISHIFSERIKINFRNYLALVRTEYAATLIRTTNDSITNIYSCAGFASQRTFNRAFKQIYGVTPSEYKNNISGFYKS